MRRYIKITRSDVDGSYIQPVELIGNAVDGELDDIDYYELGTKLILEIIEMHPDDYEQLPEFGGW